MSEQAPSVRAFYRPSAVNGVAAAGARAALLDPPWRPTLLGEEIDDTVMAASPLAGSPGLARVTWDRGERVAAQVKRVVEHIAASGARVVVPNDLPLAFVGAALLEHRGVRCAAWIHSDHLDGEDLVTRCGELAHAWSAVTAGATAHVRRTGAAEGLDLAEPCEPVWVCTDLPARVRDISQSPAPTRLLYAGRIERMVKRTTDLVELVARLREAGARFRLTIAGTGPAEAWMRGALAEEIRAGLIEMPGAVPLARMGELVDAHDAVILVSGSEGMPNIVMEAFVRGRGAFLTDGCGGAAELVAREPGAGRVVATGHMAAMARAVARMDRAGLAAMGRAARAAACVFDITTVSQRYHTLIRTAAGAPARGARATWARVRRALTGVDGAADADVRELWEWWNGELGAGASVGSDDLTLPAVASPAERALERALRELAAAGLLRVALYGAGAHTKKVARVIGASPLVRVIIDDRAGEAGGPPRVICGREVVVPGEIGAHAIDAVVVSSDEHERDMIVRAREFAGAALVVGLYSGSGAAGGA